MSQCTATSKTTGQRCRRAAMRGKTVCYMHGGKTPAGMASPHFRHGRYSKVLPDRLAGRYQQALQDPELLALRDEIALVDARKAELLGRVLSGESGEAWRQAQRQQQALTQSLNKGDIAAARAAILELERIIGRGLADYAAWREIQGLLDQRERLVRSERQRMVQAQQMISLQQVMVFVNAISSLVREHVRDPDTLAAISAGIRAYLSRDSQAPGPGPDA